VSSCQIFVNEIDHDHVRGKTAGDRRQRIGHILHAGTGHAQVQDSHFFYCQHVQKFGIYVEATLNDVGPGKFIVLAGGH
jgi:hypothetical protein